MHQRVEAVLKGSDVEYVVRRHADCTNPITSPQDFAKCLGYELNRITKSLFVRSINKDRYGIVVAPMDKKVDFAVVAESLLCSRVEVANRSELSDMIGYPPTGVSPLGVGDLPVVFDESLFKHETVLIGGGVAGVEIEIAPRHLVALTGAKVVKLSL